MKRYSWNRRTIEWLALLPWVALISGCTHLNPFGASQLVGWMVVSTFIMCGFAALIAIFARDVDRKVAAGGVAIVAIVVVLILLA